MNQDFVFLKYQPTPGEKYMGIASVRLFGKVVHRYKIQPSKDGASFYPTPASYKIPDPAGGQKDCFISAFMLDSQSDNEELKNFIISHVNHCIEQMNAQSVHAANNQYQQAAPQYQQQYQQPQQQAQYQQPNYNNYQQPQQTYQQASVFDNAAPSEELPF